LFRESLSVITSAFLTAGADRNECILLYEPPVKLKRKSGDPLLMSVAQTYRVVPHENGYKAKTTSYSYQLLVEKDKDKEQQAILEFHWNPKRLRISNGCMSTFTAQPRGELRRKHFPTARLAIEDFIRFLIRDFSVIPRMPYSQCKEILLRNKAVLAAQLAGSFRSRLSNIFKTAHYPIP
jgi:hypothetical protein